MQNTTTITTKRVLLTVSALLLLALISTAFLWNAYNESNKDVKRLKSNNKALNQEIKEKTNLIGEKVSEVRVARYRMGELKEENKELYDRITAYAKKGKGVENYVRVTTETRDKVSAPIILPQKEDSVIFVTKTDTLKSLPFAYNDNFLSISGEVKPKNVDLDYKIISEQELLYRWEGQGKWFKEPYLVVDVKTSNPKEEVRGIEAIKIEPAKKKFYQTRGFIFGVGFVLGSATIISVVK